MHNSSAWRWLRYELEHKKYGPVYTINLDGHDQTIEQHSAKVDRLIDEIRAETGARKVQLVGHSMGGLIATWVASYRPHHVAKVITLGAPMEGTCVAKLLKSPSVLQMRQNSPFLTELKKHAETLTMVPFVHIASEADQIVVPQDSGVPNYTPDSKRVWVDGLGHFSLLLSNRIFTILKSELKKNSG
jgi:pimeloyl-ACP methyl ester carboxylesterase